MEDSFTCPKSGQHPDESANTSAEPVSVQELMDRIAGDLDLLGRLLTIFVSDYHQCFCTIQEAIQAGDSESLHKLAHRMKGALGNFGAHKAYEAAQRLEGIGLTGDLPGAETVWEELQAEIIRVKSAIEGIVAKGAPCPSDPSRA